MMRPNQDVPVFLYTEYVDFRKAIAGLSLIVEQAMGKNPFLDGLFVFTNRQRNKIKLLYWERNGFCLWYKSLEKERFKWPTKTREESVLLTTEELNWLLDGFDLWNNRPHQKLVYSAVS